MTLQLRRDYLQQGLVEFTDAAGKKYGDEPAMAGIEACQGKNWSVLKPIFMRNLDQPLLANVAEELERSIQRIISQIALDQLGK